MFTGIVESLGTIVALGPRVGEDVDASTRRMVVATDLPVERMPEGASIAVDGVCLTLVDRSAGRFAADLGPETLACTTFANRKVGERVHLERPLAVGDALGGHIVAGHVDGVGSVVAARQRGDAREVEVSVPAELSRYLVPKGSVTIDGVSLTINTVGGDGDKRRFSVTLIPHTLAVTLLGDRAVGAAVNVEVDLIAKHVDRLVAHYVGQQGARQ